MHLHFHSRLSFYGQDTISKLALNNHSSKNDYQGHFKLSAIVIQALKVL